MCVWNGCASNLLSFLYKALLYIYSYKLEHAVSKVWAVLTAKTHQKAITTRIESQKIGPCELSQLMLP